MTDTPVTGSHASVEIDAAVLRELRQELGLTQIALGKSAGLAAGYISQLETGHRTHIRPPAYAKLCDALQIRPTHRSVLRKSAGKQAA